MFSMFVLKPTSKFSIDNIYCFAQNVNSIIYKIIGKKGINFWLEFNVYFILMSLFLEYNRIPKSEKHWSIMSSSEKMERDVSVDTSSGGFPVFMNIHPVKRENVSLIHEKGISRYIHKEVADRYFTHPFSSFRCWYNSNLLLTELALPTNSWCFLELAAVMRLVHMVRSETGPAETGRRGTQIKNTYLPGSTSLKIYIL